MSLEIVSMKNGKIKGKIVQLKVKEAKPVYVYRNIPFAKPPVGSLRFMPPQPAVPWEGIKNGTTVGSMPMFKSGYEEVMDKVFPLPLLEDPVKLSEDCLHLTVYSPCPQEGKKLPVMVWFYGGGFSMGSERYYEGSVIPALNDIVLVIPNYRVGIFGFFSLGKNSLCTGNAGIMDQQLALKWVQENIDKFGGDKDNVTIFGESAGGVSVHLNIVSPLSRGSFHKAISHSGQIQMPILFHGEEKNDRVKAITMRHFKIDETDDRKILEAMQKIPSKELNEVQIALEKERVQFAPMVDGKVFEKTPKQYLVDNEFIKVPYIIGCNSTEGFGLFGSFAGDDFEKGLSEENSRMMLPFTLTDEGWQKCKKFYEIEKMGDVGFSKLLGHAYGDGVFVAPASQASFVHAAAGAIVYKYLGDFQLEMHHDPENGKEVIKKPEWCICDHADDIYLTFGFPFHPYGMQFGVKFSKKEEELSLKWMTYITNFAKTGDPNVGKKVETQWPRYNTQGRQHLVVAHNMSIGSGFRTKEVKHWAETMPTHICES